MCAVSPEKVTTWKTSLEQSARLSLDLEIGSLCCFHCKDVLSFIWIWKSGTNCLIMAQVEEVDTKQAEVESRGSDVVSFVSMCNAVLDELKGIVMAGAGHATQGHPLSRKCAR